MKMIKSAAPQILALSLLFLISGLGKVSLAASNTWSSVAASRSTNNNAVSVAIPATGSRKFFRLSLP